jgi:Type IV secretion system pilin
MTPLLELGKLIKYSNMITILLNNLHKVGIFLSLLIPTFLLADEDEGSPAVAKGSVKLISPLGDVTIKSFLLSLIDVVMILAIPLIVFFIIYSGFLYVTAQGNPEKIKQASKALTYAVIGALLILGATAIVKIVESLVESFKA